MLTLNTTWYNKENANFKWRLEMKRDIMAIINKTPKQQNHNFESCIDNNFSQTYFTTHLPGIFVWSLFGVRDTRYKLDMGSVKELCYSIYKDVIKHEQNLTQYARVSKKLCYNVAHWTGNSPYRLVCPSRTSLSCYCY
jgi:hypothetical protein